MTVEQARRWYEEACAWAEGNDPPCSPWGGRVYCSTCRRIYQTVDAASIALDLAVAEAARDIARARVAY